MSGLIHFQRLVGLCALLAIHSACGATDARQAAPDVLLPVDTVILQEDSTLPLGEPHGFAVLEDGSFAIGDRFSRVIQRFSPEGALLGTYGQPGGGPGEFRALAFVMEPAPGQVAGADGDRGVLVVFDVDTGEMVLEHRTGGFVSDVDVMSGGIVFGAPNPADLLSFELVSALGNDSAERLLPIPAILAETPSYLGHNPNVYSAWWRDSGRGVAAYAMLNEVFMLDDGLESLGQPLPVPVVRRRGVPDNVLEFMNQPLAEKSAALSMVQNLHALPGGDVAVVHEDLTMEGAYPSLKVVADLFLSVGDPTSGVNWCVDMVIPVGDVVRPRTAFGGESLFVLDRVLTTVDVLTVVRQYDLRSLGCRQ